MRGSRTTRAAAHLVLAWIGLLGRGAVARVPGPSPGDPYAAKIAGASDEGERAIKRFRLSPGLKVACFAAEPLLANPVALAVDARNRFYVAETFRYHAGVTDIRAHMDWLEDDLAGRPVEDRVAMYRKYPRERAGVRVFGGSVSRRFNDPGTPPGSGPDRPHPPSGMVAEAPPLL